MVKDGSVGTSYIRTILFKEKDWKGCPQHYLPIRVDTLRLYTSMYTLLIKGWSQWDDAVSSKDASEWLYVKVSDGRVCY